MLAGISDNILKYYDFMLMLMLIVIIFGFLLEHKFKNFNLDIKNIRLYTLFLHLDNFSIIALSGTVIRHIFVIWYILALPSYHISYLVFLTILGLVFNVCMHSYLNIIFDIFNSIIQYLSLILLSLLVGYLYDVRFIWYVIIMVILLGIFILTYATYFLLKNLNSIIVKER